MHPTQKLGIAWDHRAIPIGPGGELDYGEPDGANKLAVDDHPKLVLAFVW
jgi:hypothetical protein